VISAPLADGSCQLIVTSSFYVQLVVGAAGVEGFSAARIDISSVNSEKEKKLRD
jgi:hypothetical protein